MMREPTRQEQPEAVGARDGIADIRHLSVLQDADYGNPDSSG